MKYLKYDLCASKYGFKTTIEYQKSVPTNVSSLAKKALENNKSIIDYLESKHIGKQTQMFKIIRRSFKGFEEFIDYPKSKLEELIVGDSVIKSKSIKGRIESLAPLVNKFKILMDGEQFTINNEEELSEKLILIFKKENPEAIGVRTRNIWKGEKYKERVTIELSVKNGEFYYLSHQVNDEHIDIAALRIQNNLIKGKFNTTNVLSGEARFLATKQVTHTIDGVTANVEVNGMNIKFKTMLNWKGLSVYETANIREHEFIKDTPIYDFILHLYRENKIEINQFIFIRFLQNELDLREKLMKNHRLIRRTLDMEETLKEFLVLDIKTKISERTSVEFISNIVEKSTLEEFPIIMAKIPNSIKDKMTSLGLLEKLDKLAPELLSGNQSRILRKEKFKFNKLKNDFQHSINKIIQMGLVDDLDTMTGVELRKIGGTGIKKWISKNVIDANLDEVATIERLRKSIALIRKYQKVLDDRKKKK